MLICLQIGTAYSGPPASNKPYKVCPEIVTAKDTPCHALGAEAAIVHRMEIVPTENRLETENKILKEMIEKLSNKIEELETQIRGLQSK